MATFLERDLGWIVSQLASTVGFLLALVLFAHLLRQKRPPGSTMAWLLIIIFLPYVGVPLYLMLGGRKMQRLARHKERVYHPPSRIPTDSTGGTTERILRSYGVPRATCGNVVELAGDGETAYRTILRLIDGAEREIHVTTYILGGDAVGEQIVEHLTRRAAEGIQVRVLLDSLGTWWMRRRQVAPLRAAGARVAFFMPMIHAPWRGRANLRNHRKIVAIDGKKALAGGMNLANEYMGPRPDPKRWRDLSVLVEGPAARVLDDLFRSDWKFATGEDLAADDPVVPVAAGGRASATFPHNGGSRWDRLTAAMPTGQVPTLPLAREGAREDAEFLEPSPDQADSGSHLATPTDGEAIVQVVASGPDVSGDPLYESLIHLLFSATRRFWVVTPYFVPDETLVRALELAARRGIDVKLIVPARSNHLAPDLARASYLRQVRDAGGQVLLFGPGMLHAKVVLIDDDLAVVGSANMDMRSLFLNFEVALFLYSRTEVQAVAEWVQRLRDECRSGLPKCGHARELAENVARLLSPLL